MGDQTVKTTSQPEELDPEALARYRIGSENAIQNLLQSLVERRILVGLKTPQGKNQILSTLLSADGELVFDASRDHSVNRTLTESEEVLCMAQDAGIYIQFSVHNVRAQELDGINTLVCPAPREILRIQRRETYRVNVPVNDWVACQIVLTEKDGEQRSLELRVLDISIGGLTLLLPDKNTAIEPGDKLEECLLRLPGTEPMQTALKVHNKFAITGADGEIRRRIGCSFSDLPGWQENRIQRYVFALERRQRARARL